MYPRNRRAGPAVKLLVVALIALAGLSTPRHARAYFNLPLLYWPLDDAHRHVISFPDTGWTWEHLGLNPGYTCPDFDERDRDASRDVWRDPAIPEEQDWLQASLGNRGVACHRDHAGTDIAAPPLTPVYAVADGVVTLVEARSDAKGDNGSVEIEHRREFRDEPYTWRARYVHLDNDFPVTEGPVKAGQIIGHVADRGTNSHLHFQIDGLWPCIEDCIVNPWGPTSLWIDFDDDGAPDPATNALRAARRRRSTRR
jgi:murein DD-endopeptidase MepM/ murein hydrolase activator NlpD